MLQKLKDRLKGYALKVAIRKGSIIAMKWITSGGLGLYLSTLAAPYVVKYQLDPEQVAAAVLALTGTVAILLEFIVDAIYFALFKEKLVVEDKPVTPK